MNRGLTIGIAVVLAVVGCGDGTHQAAGRPQEQVPTAKNTISISAAEISNVPLVRPTADLVLGSGAHGENDEFGAVSAIDVGTDGRIAVLDAVQYQVTVFNSDGVPERRFGRKGGGPGELEFPSNLFVHHDSILVHAQSVHLFDAQGKYVRTYAKSPSLPTSTILASSDAGLIISHQQRGKQEKVSRTDTTVVYLITPSGQSQRVSAFSRTSFRYGDAMEYSPVLTPGTILTASRSGSVYTVIGDSLDIAVYGADGILHTRYVSPVPRVTISDEDISDFTEAMQHNFVDVAKVRVDVPNFRKTGPVPEFRPVISTLIVSDRDQMLLRRNDITPHPYSRRDRGGTADWLFIAKGGKPLAHVQLPNRFQPRGVVSCMIYGRSADSSGLPTVERYSLADHCE
jgi:hypothetical protein